MKSMIVALMIASVTPAVHPFPSLGGEGSRAWGVNDSGYAVGRANAGTANHAVRWAPNGSVTDLGALPGDTGSVAYAINAGGTAVGTSSTANGSRAVRWAPDGTATVLASPSGHAFCEAKAINDAGMAAGYCQQTTNTATRRAVRWESDGSVGLFSELATEANGIGPDGTVVGSAVHRRKPVRWGPDGSLTILSVPVGSEYGASANAINRNGVIVGDVFIGQGPGYYRAVLWNADGTRVDLDSDSYSWAYGINDSNVVVGMSYYSFYYPTQWTADGKPVRLPVDSGPEGYRNVANGINNNGLIVGTTLEGTYSPDEYPGHAVYWR